MTYSIDEQLLVGSIDELRALNGRADVSRDEAAQLSLAAQSALAQSIAAERPRELTEVVLARYRRKWKWRILFLSFFLPIAIVGATLFGVTIFTLFTAFIWR